MEAATAAWIVVSGGSGSLGRAMATRFAALGGPVLSLDRQPAEAAQGVTDRVADLTDPDAVRGALDDAIPKSDKIGLLVNAVGLIWNEPVIALKGASFKTHDIARWNDVIASNLTAAFVVASAVAARMARRGGGSIVNFSSVVSSGNPGQVAYSAAKAGVEGMTRTMAAELGPLGVRVNAIAPGFIDVASTRQALPAERLEQIRQRTALKRLGTVDDVFAAIRFLHESPFVTGTVLGVDGGLRR